jgi:hypothetical protein
MNDLFEKNKAMIDAWLEELKNDPHHQAVMAEVAEYNKEIKRITQVVEQNYDRHAELISEALDFYLREAYKLEDLKKWK